MRHLSARIAIVHIAGSIHEHVQRCLACGVVLIDYRDVAVMAPVGSQLGLSFWHENVRVGVDGRCSYVIDEKRSLDADEVFCIPVN